MPTAARPRRRWQDRAAEAAGLNALLRQPGGTQELFPIQAVSLLEFFECEGLFCAARVGAGKTHVIGLAPTLLAAKGFDRAQILVPGSLKAKTEREFVHLRQHWKIANQYWLDSYTALAQANRADLLEERQPNLLLFDEPGAPGGVRRITGATAKRVIRYVLGRRQRGERIACGFFTGTPERSGLDDYSHMILMALGDGSPLPSDAAELAMWSAWLDDEDPSGQTAFAKYFGWDVARDQERSWDAFRDLVIHTPGIVVSDDAFEGAELSVSVHRVDPGLDREFGMLRDLWQRPDGWQLLDASEESNPDEVNTWSIWGIARQLALGFFYVADPPPPKEWLAARKQYADFVRAMIDAPHSKYDTEKQVRSACERSAGTGRKIFEWEAWKAVKDSFQPRSKPVWLSTHALDAAKNWGRHAPGIIWVDHTAFGERLAAETGWSFFGQKGLDAAGRSIEDASPNKTAIASRLANQQGRNLQFAFSRNLIMAMPNAALDLEQLIGRTHRHGQPMKGVHVDVYACCIEHERGVQKCLAGARGTNRRWGMSQKILAVDCAFNGDMPDSRAWR